MTRFITWFKFWRFSKLASTTNTPSAKQLIKGKIPLTQAPQFIAELIQLFARRSPITPASALVEAFKQFDTIPPKWTPNTVKKHLSEAGIITYSRKKPMGFTLNSEKLNLLLEESIAIPTRKPSKTKPSTLKKPRPSSQSSGKPKKSLSSKPRKISSESHKAPSKTQSTRDILNKIPTFPPYLMKRLSTKTRKVLNLGAIELNAIKPLGKVEKTIDLLTSGKIFFDHTYDDEKNVMDALDARIRYLSRRATTLRDHEIDQLFEKMFIPMLHNGNGKCSKIISKWEKQQFNLQECAQRCLKKMGKKAKKIPLSEFALRQKIQAVLHTRYPKRK